MSVCIHRGRGRHVERSVTAYSSRFSSSPSPHSAVQVSLICALVILLSGGTSKPKIAGIVFAIHVVMLSLFMPLLGTRAPSGRDADAEAWHGLVVRTREGQPLGVVAGVWADDLFAGRLRVHGGSTLADETMGPPGGTAVYAIPRHAVRRREQDCLVLNATLHHARDRWLLYVVHEMAA
jgi:hypothetical protein